jgi:hypothetical protein
MKSTLKVALLATVLMVAAPVLAADATTDTVNGHRVVTDANGNTTAVDADGNPVHHHKHWHHHDADSNYINHDANPNEAALNGGMHHHGYKDADGVWHPANGEVVRNGGYRDANGVWHDGAYAGSRQYAYNDYYNRSADGRWMGIDFDSRHMTDGADTDVNNRGRHSFIFDDGKNPQDFRVGSGHVVKF